MFSGYTLRKHRNIDPIRDVNLLIQYLEDISYRDLISNDMTYGTVIRRVNNLLRRIRSRAYRYDKNKYRCIFNIKGEFYNEALLLSVVHEYKNYISKKIEDGELYRPFLKDIPKPIKINKNRIKCQNCQGKGYFDERR